MDAFFSSVVQIGKWGLTSNCVTAISDALEANELIKVFILAHLPPNVKLYYISLLNVVTRWP